MTEQEKRLSDIIKYDIVVEITGSFLDTLISHYDGMLTENLDDSDSFDFWIVSERLARQLKEVGERVVDFEAYPIWVRQDASGSLSRSEGLENVLKLEAGLYKSQLDKFTDNMDAVKQAIENGDLEFDEDELNIKNFKATIDFSSVHQEYLIKWEWTNSENENKSDQLWIKIEDDGYYDSTSDEYLTNTDDEDELLEELKHQIGRSIELADLLISESQKD
jgi:hypothetical protein